MRWDPLAAVEVRWDPLAAEVVRWDPLAAVEVRWDPLAAAVARWDPLAAVEVRWDPQAAAHRALQVASTAGPSWPESSPLVAESGWLLCQAIRRTTAQATVGRGVSLKGWAHLRRQPRSGHWVWRYR